MSRAYDSAEGRADGPNPNAAGESAPLLIDARRAQMCTFAEISGKRRDAETPGFAECEFPGWNGLESLTFKTLDLAEPDKILDKHQKLGQYMATPIAGNDISSSILYTLGLVSQRSGQLAPLCLLLVCGVLHFFRYVYSEVIPLLRAIFRIFFIVVTAIPLNGGAYNLLLNTTSKLAACIAACLTILSYTATAVVSAASAVEYADRLVPLHIIPATIAVLGVFALLTILGVRESAGVASVIFSLHMLSMFLLAFVGIVFLFSNGGSTLVANFNAPLEGSLSQTILYGFASGMLGVTGFETAANYVEECKPGVFQKILRNLWWTVFLINPLMSIVTLGVLDLSTVKAHPNSVLATLANTAGGPSFGSWIAFDGALVLSGAVLTAFIGVNGLVRRLALDRSLPAFLLETNTLRGTNHWIAIVFFGLCTSLFLILKGEVGSLANVYSLSFLLVMALFAFGCMMLKFKRSDLKRDVKATWTQVGIASVGVILALIGNISSDPEHLVVFLWYFFTMAFFVFFMFERLRLLRILAYFNSKHFPEFMRSYLHRYSASAVDEIHNTKIVFFAKDASLQTLTTVAQYIQSNEAGSWLKVVHFFTDPTSPKLEALANNLNTLDKCFPALHIDLILVKGLFCPEAVHQLAEHFKVPKTNMLMACPSETFLYRIEEFGGVRIVTRRRQRPDDIDGAPDHSR